MKTHNVADNQPVSHSATLQAAAKDGEEADEQLVKVFETQVSRTPLAVALRSTTETLTYQQLNDRANQLAHLLLARGLQPEQPVALALLRSVHLLVALLGTLKAGGAYAPLDPRHPPRRLYQLLTDLRPALVLANAATHPLLRTATSAAEPSLEVPVLDLDSKAFLAELDDQPTHNPALALSPRQLGYVMYTSGSSGQPKGVLIEQFSILNLVQDQSYAPFVPAAGQPPLVLLATCAPAFDVSTFEYWGTLLHGGELVLLDEQELLSPALLGAALRHYRVSMLWLTASWCHQLIDADAQVFASLPTLLVGGEALSPVHMARLHRACPQLTIINGYGPTENTTFSLAHELTPDDLASGQPLPLGRPMRGRTAYVLDAQLQPVMVGEAGEICVGGAGVARGYLRQPQLTADKFVADPFSPVPGALLYRTGDRGRQRADGVLEFLGRNDTQVKLRGLRLELSEIENTLNTVDTVRNSCVVVRQPPGADKKLVAYYVPNWPALKARERALYQSQVAAWKEVYETEYAKTEDGAVAADPEFNIIGWNDSFTGQPIPAPQMRAWLDNIVATVLAEQPRHVLEIGCGTGLVYYQLAGRINKYIGTDFSPSCLQQIAHTIEQGHRDYGPTELLAGAAHELALPAGELVDTVILNSIIQHFPGEDYLTSVIEKSLAALTTPGRIIIGDVRDNRLLKLFRARLHAQQLAEPVTLQEFEWDVEQIVLQEEELCLAPEYFYRLQARFPQITHVDIQWKQTGYYNELTLYRYTVLLHVGAAEPLLAPAWQAWADQAPELLAQLRQGVPTLALQDAPNPRLGRERYIDQLLQDTSAGRLTTLLDPASEEDPASAQVRELLREAQALGYHTRLFLDEDPLKVNILLEQQPSCSWVQPAYYSQGDQGQVASSNCSLFNDLSALLQKELRATLLESLPEYMVPADYVALLQLPLTFNGKVDRAFLSQRAERATAPSLAYEPPRTPLEQQLADIWQELLGRENIGRDDNFFALGGHSLLAMRVVAAVRKDLGVEVAIKDVFAGPTIAQLAQHLQGQERSLPLPALVAQPRPAHTPLSFSQERLWFIDQLKGSTQYHAPVVLRLKGRLDVEALAAALGTIVQRHEVLRTVLREEQGQAYQQVLAPDWQLTLTDKEEYQDDPEALRYYVQQLINAPFDLAHDSMLRANLIKVLPKEHLLVLTVHHIAADGWSLSILFRELVAAYEAHRQRRPVVLPPLPIQYADYALWQRQQLPAAVLESQLSYWQQQLRDVSHLALPTDFVRPATQGSKGASFQFRLDQALTGQLQQLSQQHSSTLFMTLLAGFKVLLHRYSGQEDICVGSAIAGRQQQEVEGLIGFFVNTLALRSQVQGTDSFAELLQQVKNTTLEAYQHQQVPFEKVVDAVGQQRDLSRSPLFQVMFVLQNTPDLPNLNLGTVQATREIPAHATAQFDLTIALTQDAQGLEGFVEYSTDLYREATIGRLVDHYAGLLRAIASHPQQALNALPLITRAERRQLVEAPSSPGLAAAAEANEEQLVQAFEEQVRRKPQAVALRTATAALTYHELNEQANQLAHLLLARGIQPEQPVALALPRSPLLLVAILATLKAGAAYAPLDYRHPPRRLRQLLTELQAPLLLTSAATTAHLRTALTLPDAPAATEEADAEANASAFDVAALPVLDLESAPVLAELDSQPTHNPGLPLTPHQLAYVMFTSGSTGPPKGVLIEQASIVNLVRHQAYFPASPAPVLLATGAPAFDATTFEYWATLLHGGTLVLLDEHELLSPAHLAQALRQHGVSLLWLTASWCHQLIDADATLLAPLTTLLVGGEALSPAHMQRLQRACPALAIVNGYGPTENTTFSLTHRLTPADLRSGLPLPLGRPLRGRTAYVLDAHLQPVGPSVVGDIWVGGAGVARGYLRQPQLTADKFVPDPFSSVPGARLYRTGDQGRWRPDGLLDFLGRADNQVKIRGFRLELSEIENVLHRNPEVKQAVVLVKTSVEGVKQLVAYVVPMAAFDQAVLVSYLKARLPDYMVPTLWVGLPLLPLTLNGKLDTRALPEPSSPVPLAADYLAPRTDIEQTLAAIWRQVLRQESVGLTSNFFDLGGDSILTIQVVSRARLAGYTVHPKDLFEHQTLEQLAQVISERLTFTEAGVAPALRHSAMTAIQKEGSNIPFFALPGFLLYRYLGEHFSTDQPFYGFEPELSPYKTIDELAQHFIQEVKQVRPQGPYLLGAFCGDYPVVFEAAHALLAQGEQVPLIVLFEAFPPSGVIPKRSLQYIRRKLGYYYTEFNKLSTRGKLTYPIRELYNTWQLLRMKLTLTRKHKDYVPHTYPGNIVLFRASLSAPGITEEPHGGWASHVTGTIDSVSVTGEHLTIFKNPHAAELAEKLAQVLARAQPEVQVKSAK